MHIHIYIYIYAYTHIYTHIYTYIHIHIHIYIYIHTYIHIYAHIYTVATPNVGRVGCREGGSETRGCATGSFYCMQRKKENQRTTQVLPQRGRQKGNAPRVLARGRAARSSLPASRRSALWNERIVKGVNALSVRNPLCVRLPLDCPPRSLRARPLNPLPRLALPGDRNPPDRLGWLDLSSGSAALSGTYLPRTTCPRRGGRSGRWGGSSAPVSAGLPQSIANPVDLTLFGFQIQGTCTCITLAHS